MEEGVVLIGNTATSIYTRIKSMKTDMKKLESQPSANRWKIRRKITKLVYIFACSHGIFVQADILCKLLNCMAGWLISYALVISPVLLFINIFYLVITGFETENKYSIKNAVGQQVYFAAEGNPQWHLVHFVHCINTLCRVQLLLATVLWTKQAICHGHYW